MPRKIIATLAVIAALGMVIVASSPADACGGFGRGCSGWRNCLRRSLAPTSKLSPLPRPGGRGAILAPCTLQVAWRMNTSAEQLGER